MHRQSTINNVLAGTFLIGAIVVAVVLSFVFSGMSFERTRAYAIRFDLSTGAAGIQPGSTVTLGGRPVGQVETLMFDPPKGVPESIVVRVRIDADLTLFGNASAYLVRPLLGTLSTINIASPGDAGGGPALAAGGELRGELAPPSFLSEAGFGPRQQEQLREILTQMENASRRFNAILEPFEDRSESLAALSERTLTDLSEASHNLRVRLDQWSLSLDRAVTDIEWFTGELQPMVLAMREGVDEASLLARRGNEFLDRNEEGVGRAIESANRALTRLDEEMLPEYTLLARDARERIARLDPTLEEMDAFARTELLPSLRRTLANAAVSTGFLKHAIAEIRDQPWRLLIRPTQKELAEQLTYDAARTYAGAVSDLRSASEALAVLLESPGAGVTGRSVEVERVRAYAERLQEAFVRYEEAERSLLDRLVGGK